MRLAGILMILIVLAACGGGDSGTSDSDTINSANGTRSSDADYSVVMVAGVDAITADGQLAELTDAGFDGFIKDGSADTGFDIYRSGLSLDDAEALLEEIRAALYPDGNGTSFQRGLVWETGSWRIDSNDVAGGSSGDSSASSASITVGSKVYEFTTDLPNQCTDTGSLLFGTFAEDAEGNAMEGGDANRSVALTFGIPLTDWESQDLRPPQIGVDDATTGERRQAGGVSESNGIDPEQSQVLSWTMEDGHAEGTATFIDLNAHFAGKDPEPVEGSFEIECAS